MSCSCCDGSESVVRAIKTNEMLGCAAGKSFGNSRIVTFKGSYRMVVAEGEHYLHSAPIWFCPRCGRYLYKDNEGNK